MVTHEAGNPRGRRRGKGTELGEPGSPDGPMPSENTEDGQEPTEEYRPVLVGPPSEEAIEDAHVSGVGVIESIIAGIAGGGVEETTKDAAEAPESGSQSDVSASQLMSVCHTCHTVSDAGSNETCPSCGGALEEFPPLSNIDYPERVPESDRKSPEEPDPTARIGRPRRKRGSTVEEPQTAFGDVVLDVENVEAELLAQLEAREEHREAASIYDKADKDIKDRLKTLGYYDGKPHNVRAGQFLIVIAPSDKPGKDVNFYRGPSIRTTISWES